MVLCHGPSATTAIRILVLLLASLRISSALRTVPGSECERTCSSGTLEEDSVCLDAEYQSKPGGRQVESCVSCLLNSTAVDTATNVTDVQWGLYSLRWTLSSCMFGIPEERVSISSPCQVTCAPLSDSIAYRLANDSDNADPSTGYCTAGNFDSTIINNCAFCYSLIPQQLFTANFLQALHIQCRDPPANGEPFFPSAPTIFNETLIAGPAAPSSNTGGGGGLSGTSLALAISLPVVCGIFAFGFGCWCCFIVTRRRRRNMAASGRMSRVHEQQVDGGSMYSPIEGKTMWGEAEPPREMHQLTPHLPQNTKGHSPVTQQNRWSQHYPPGTAVGDDGTPLRNSFHAGRDDVGPGAGQLQDHNLHEQYFGVADGGEDDGPARNGLGLYGEGHSGTHTPQIAEPVPRGSGVRGEDERGQWVQ